MEQVVLYLKAFLISFWLLCGTYTMIGFYYSIDNKRDVKTRASLLASSFLLYYAAALLVFGL